MNDPLASYPGYVMRRASSAALAALNRRLAPLGLRHVDASLLILIGARPGITQSEAGRTLDIQRANMVPIVARLEGRGLLDRRRADGRSQGLYLSAGGEAQCAAAHAEIAALEGELTAALPEPLRDVALAVLTALWRASESLVDPL